MSIENKIAQILAESKQADLDALAASALEEEEIKRQGTSPMNPDEDRNNVSAQKIGGKDKTTNANNKDAAPGEASNIDKLKTDGVTKVEGDEPNVARNSKAMKEDIDALMNGEDLSEEFKLKATTIYEAAVMSRVKQEVARLEEEFDARLEEKVEIAKEGLVEKVDGYLGYISEQWIAQNEIALEHGMKSEILEGFVSGLKGLFEEHYIDIPAEKFDVVASLEEQVEQLSSKLDETVAVNVEMKKSLSEMRRAEIVKTIGHDLSDTEAEKLAGLAEELSYEDEKTFTAKVQTIRENYFTTKAQADSASKSVVTDNPVDLVETGAVSSTMSAYLKQLNTHK